MGNRYKQRPLILASSSPRRQELIRLLGLPYEIVVKPVNEQITSSNMGPPEGIVRELAQRKAKAVYDEDLKDTKKDGVIIGVDTIVVLDDTILGKPQDQQAAFHMLASLQGRTHHVFSGIACIDTQTGNAIVNHRKTSVTIKPLTDHQIERYIQTGEPRDKAGAYGIQGVGAVIVEKIEGDYFNVVGLSLSLLSNMLSSFGIEVI